VSLQGCHGQHAARHSTRRVTGLGDQATAMLATAGLDAATSSPHTGAELLVWSSNSQMVLSYSATACSWNSSTVNLQLLVTIDANADSALGGYESDVQNADLGRVRHPRNGTQTVKGVGQLATAVFVTWQGTPEVDLYVLSGNAEIEMSIDGGALPRTLTRAGEVAADIAKVRDVLSGLRRT
jgi:hypothetical protein